MKRSFIIHVRTHTGEKPYSFSHCDQSFADSSSFKRHQITHSGEKPYSCSYCNKVFALKEPPFKTGKKHSERKHTVAGTCSPLNTRHCFFSQSVIFFTPKHCQNHSGHTVVSKYDKDFISNSNLKKHLMTHTREMRFQCNQCDKAFANNTSLIRHLRTHTGEKPYQCSQCVNSFYN